MSFPLNKSLTERLVQMVLFEATGLLLMAPVLASAAGTDSSVAFLLLALTSALALAWHVVFNIGFDKCERRYVEKNLQRRGTPVRIVHALAFEAGLLVLTLPVVVWVTGLGWWAALIADVALSAAYALYAFCFTWLYDALQPFVLRGSVLAAPNENSQQN